MVKACLADSLSKMYNYTLFQRQKIKNQTTHHFLFVLHTACPERQASVGPGTAQSCRGRGKGSPGGVGGRGHLCELRRWHVYSRLSHSKQLKYQHGSNSMTSLSVHSIIITILLYMYVLVV